MGPLGQQLSAADCRLALEVRIQQPVDPPTGDGFAEKRNSETA